MSNQYPPLVTEGEVTCAKCGLEGGWVSMRYEAIGFRRADGSYGAHDEWIERECERCHYIWREAVISSSPVRGTADEPPVMPA